MNLRGAARFPFRRLRPSLFQLRVHLCVAARQLLRALPVERNLILVAVHFQGGQVQHVLVLPYFSVQLVNPLIQLVLLAFHLLKGC